jgi:hypothetical protein
MSNRPNERLPIDPPKRFVPSGVDAQSWMGFEQRIQERRFRALIETMKMAIATGDPAAARAALDEARELRPRAPELNALEARIGAIPLDDESSARVIRTRALGAAAMLAFGVSLITGLDYFRSSTPVAPPPTQVVAPQIPADVVMSPVRSSVGSPGVSATTGRAPEQPRATIGIEERQDEELTLPITLAPPPLDPEPSPPGEVPDDFVYPGEPITVLPRSSRAVPLAPLTTPGRATAFTAGSRTPAAAPVPAATVASPSQPAGRPVTRTPAIPAALPAVAARDEQRLVAGVLDAYARAYSDLDAAAARDVWPSVNERALARAFDALASQHVAFDDCRIDVRGVAASATCRGRASYVGKVGSGDARTEAREWQFDLRRDGEAWKIANAAVR